MPSRVKGILFVCTGNTCRSLIAEALARKFLQDRKITDLTVFSRGIAGSPLFQVPEVVNRLLAEENLDVSGHQSQTVSGADLEKADLVLVMEKLHKDVLTQRFPQYSKKFFLLAENSGDIPDPIGQSEEVYRRCFEEIKLCLDKLVKKLKD